MKWCAEQGHAGAQYSLGNMYRRGEGVPEDDAEAVGLYRLAAKQGTHSRRSTSAIYNNREGVPEDDVQAYAWFNLAAAQGNKAASKNKGLIRKGMTSAQIAEAQKLSKKMCAKIPNCAK